jgi:crotonobetainyl-CoA:carnitine CoA-transferase CaiB-like acyl-CoA transferase
VAGLLEGIRVLDFGRFIAAPYAAMMLADFGADVIRIERREGGEDRRVGPVTHSGDGGLFLNLNRNKRGMTLDPAQAGARPVVERLIAGSDIVIANLPIDILTKLRLDYESLRAIKPEIILVMASAFGAEGPYRERVGFDGVLQAMSGAMSLTGFPDEPMRSIVPWADYGTALHAAFGALAALQHRAATGRGQLVDVSLLATSMVFMNPYLLEHAATGICRTRQGNTAFYTAPSDAYQTRDGWILVPTIGDHMFRRWAKLMGREDLLADPRLTDDISRANNVHVIGDVMVAWCAARTRKEAIEALERARIPCGPVYAVDEVPRDPHVAASNLTVSTPMPGGGAPLPLTRPAVRLSETPGAIRRSPPELGEHTDEILAELNFSEAEIAKLRREAVI